MRNLVVSDALQAQRQAWQQRLQDRREAIQLRLQELRSRAADDRLDARERAQDRRLAAQLEAQDRRLAESLQRYGNPVAGLDAQGNPVYMQFGKDGSQQVVPGFTPPMASQSRIATTALTAMLKADTEALLYASDAEKPGIVARMNQTRETLNQLIGRAGVKPPAQSPAQASGGPAATPNSDPLGLFK